MKFNTFTTAMSDIFSISSSEDSNPSISSSSSSSSISSTSANASLSDEAFQANVEMLKSILGDDVTIERVRHALRGADGQVEIALNHLLNDKERERARSDSPTESSSLTPLEKVLCELAEEVKCPMCLSYFRQPVILSCFHTFCNSCLEGLVVDNQIQCPLCRDVVELRDGLSGLKPNHYLANIVEKLKSAQSTKMCAECQKSICTVFCKQCKGFLCTECDLRMHALKLLYNHHRVPFEDLFFKQSIPRSISQSSFDFSLEQDFVIPFNVKKEVCNDMFYCWIKELWFAPSDLQRKAKLSEFKAIYVPYWLFETEVITNYSYSIGHSDKLTSSSIGFYHTINSSSAALNTHWTANSGTYTTKYNNITVCASDSQEAQLLNDFEPFKLEQIQPLTLKHVDNVHIPPFTLDSNEAWKSFGKSKAEQQNRELFEKKIMKNAGANQSICNLTLEPTFSVQKSKRLFVPIYVTTYEFRGKSYQFLINGSTAKVIGQRPYSTGKLASLSVTGIGAAIGLISTRMNS